LVDPFLSTAPPPSTPPTPTHTGVLLATSPSTDGRNGRSEGPASGDQDGQAKKGARVIGPSWCWRWCWCPRSPSPPFNCWLPISSNRRPPSSNYRPPTVHAAQVFTNWVNFKLGDRPYQVTDLFSDLKVRPPMPTPAPAPTLALTPTPAPMRSRAHTLAPTLGRLRSLQPA